MSPIEQLRHQINDVIVFLISDWSLHHQIVLMTSLIGWRDCSIADTTLFFIDFSNEYKNFYFFLFFNI